MKAALGGRYQLGRRLGEGGTADVYEAWHGLTGRPVALKRIRAGGRSTEAQACGSVRHPGVVEILDAGWDGAALILVFERLNGGTVQSALEHRRLAPRELVRLVRRLLEALGAIHAAGWVHADIKPANIVLAACPSGGGLEPKIIDFGSAVPLNARCSGPVFGTPEFVSPEQSRGAPMDGRSDIWSLGALLYRGLTGWPAWPSTDAVGHLEGPLSAPNPSQLRADLPLDVAGFVRRCLNPQIDRRWSSAKAAGLALSAVDERGLESLLPPLIANSTCVDGRGELRLDV